VQPSISGLLHALSLSSVMKLRRWLLVCRTGLSAHGPVVRLRSSIELAENEREDHSLAPGNSAPGARGEASALTTAPRETTPSSAASPLPVSVKASPAPLPAPISLAVATATAQEPSPSPKSVTDRQSARPASKPTPARSPQDKGAVHGGVQDPDGTAVPDVNVDLTPSTGGQPLTTTTDDEGAFEFSIVLKFRHASQAAKHMGHRMMQHSRLGSKRTFRHSARKSTQISVA